MPKPMDIESASINASRCTYVALFLPPNFGTTPLITALFVVLHSRRSTTRSQIWRGGGGGLPAFSDKLSPTAHTEMLWGHLTRAQDRFKKQADKQRTDRAFTMGDQVLLKLQPYVQVSIASRPCRKLAYKYFGPFTIVERVDTLAYRLDLPPDSRIHPVFHISQLKPFIPNYSPVFSELPKIPDLTTTPLVPVAI
ncbi:uncharacterized protein LOC123403353 [Hordeum vulgare subsp. vulgare]|uniref:uncharacterized protein LOC123403353 n=1 Tax=Hordeum vulgare subsp. vulgare TaxID=112509 RepID=UPI001D1A4EE4|nr:uncharacterized protein LOC123403353 [Hordeum vulgare subsp. vulgare]